MDLSYHNSRRSLSDLKRCPVGGYSGEKLTRQSPKCIVSLVIRAYVRYGGPYRRLGKIALQLHKRLMKRNDLSISIYIQIHPIHLNSTKTCLSFWVLKISHRLIWCCHRDSKNSKKSFFTAEERRVPFTSLHPRRSQDYKELNSICFFSSLPSLRLPPKKLGRRRRPQEFSSKFFQGSLYSVSCHLISIKSTNFSVLLLRLLSVQTRKRLE